MPLFNRTPMTVEEETARNAERLAKQEDKAARRTAKNEEQMAKLAEQRAKQRSNILGLANREFARSRINLGAIKLDERQTLYLAMIFKELVVMNDRAAKANAEAEAEAQADSIDTEEDSLT
jgi:hypothetical protein